jgi:Flp pilus assembly protein TadD
LSPLNPLPISPELHVVPLVLGLIGLAAVTLVAWMRRRSWPLLAATWIGYVVLIAPIAGLTPSGLQATADRYLYVPSVVISLAAGAAVSRLLTSRLRGEVGALAAAAVIATLGVATWRQAHYWRNSIALWTRAAELDPRNDVATYNLAIALAEAGRDEEAIGRYEQTLTLVPDHDLARHNLAVLQASRAEREADRLAAAGRVDEASEQYGRALALDAKRPHARAAHGMLLMRRGRFHEAAAELRLAIEEGVKDEEVPNALAFALVHTGDSAEAARVLGDGVAAHPDNVNLKHNLARVLATAPDPRVRNAARAVQLAEEVCERTGNRDPRALDTLAAAYAAAGRPDLARATLSRAVARARELGDAETAAEIAAHEATYGRRDIRK